MIAASESEQPRRSLWTYPVKWLREESFWRDTTTRTLSAVLAAAVLFLAAGAIGLLYQVPWSMVGKTLTTDGEWLREAGMLVSLISVATSGWGRRSANDRTSKRLRDTIRRVSEIVDRICAEKIRLCEWEEQLAERDRQHREAVDDARRARGTTHTKTAQRWLSWSRH